MLFITIGSVGGALLLVFLVRRMTGHRRTFEEYREEYDRRTAATLAAIRQTNDSLACEEALGPVFAGLRELLAERGPACAARAELTDGKVRLFVSAPVAGSVPDSVRAIEIDWLVHTSTLSPLGHERTLQGQGHWEVRSDSGARLGSFRELAELMRLLESLLPVGDGG